MGENDDQHGLDVTPSAETPERRSGSEEQERLEEYADGMVEADGEEFLDVLRCVGIAQVLEQV